MLVWLNKQERSLLADVIDLHTEGILVAKSETTLDPTIDTADRLLDLMSGYDDDCRVLKKVKGKLK